MDDLKIKVEKMRQNKNATLRARYKLARDLGFDCYESMILSHKPEKKIIEIAKKRGFKC